MTWARAMGSAACDAAVRYCLEVVHGRGGGASSGGGGSGGVCGGAASGAGAASDTAGGAAAPLRILDPFCGEGSVLAAANALGVDALGVDSSLKRCRHAAAYVRDGLAGAAENVLADRGTCQDSI